MDPIEIHCVDVSTPVLTRDLRWIRAGDVKQDDVLLGFDEEPHGTVQNQLRNLSEARVTYAKPAIVNGYVVHLDNGETIKCSGEHQFIVEQPSVGRNWRRVDELYTQLHKRKIGGMRPKFFIPKFLDTWEEREDREAGYLAGEFDRGTFLSGKKLTTRKSSLTDRMVEGLLNEFLEVVREKKFGNYRVDAYLPPPYHLAFEADGDYWHNRDALVLHKRNINEHAATDDERDQYLFNVFNLPVVHLSETEVNVALEFDKVPLRGGLKQVLSFIGSIRPKNGLRWWELQDISSKTIMGSGMGAIETPQITKITRAKIEVAQITTSCQTYFTAGYASHNSGRAGGVIDHAVGLLMAPPLFHVEPENLTTEAAREAERLERACAKLFEKQLLGNDFWPSVGRDVLIYGRAFIKSTMLTSLWTAQEGYPVRNPKESDKQYLMRIREWKETEGKFPYVISHVPTLSILPLLDHNDNIIATLEEKWVTAKILADEMASPDVQKLLDRGALEWWDELPVLEYTDGEWVAYVLIGTQPRDRSEDGGDLNLLLESSIRAGGTYKLLRTWRHNLGVHPVTLFPGIRTELSELEYHFKCRHFEDTITLADGQDVSFGDLATRGEKFEVLTPTGKTFAYASWDKTAPIYEITLESGRTLRMTEHHRLQTKIKDAMGNSEFKFASLIKPKDQVTVLDTAPLSEDESLSWFTPELGLVVGMLLGDGMLTQFPNRVSIGSENEHFIQEFQRAAWACNAIVSTRSRGPKQYEAQLVLPRKVKDRVAATKIHRALQLLGVDGKNAFTKQLPSWTRNLSRATITAILRGLLLTDGYIVKNSGAVTGQVSFSSRSRQLRDWVAFAAHQLGVPGILFEHEAMGKPNYRWYSFSEFIDVLLEQIDLTGKKNADELQRQRGWRKRFLADKPYHWERVRSVRLLDAAPTVCVETLGNEHVYASPVIEHNSFLADAKDALELYDFLISRLATMVYAYYLPSYVWTLGGTSAQFVGHERPTMNVVLGGVTPIYKDETLEVLPQPQQLFDADKLLSAVDDIIQRHCAAASSKLILADGREVCYGDLVHTKFKVLVPGSKKKRMHTASAWAYAFPAAVEPIYEIKLESGLIYQYTGHHKLAVNARAEKDGRIKRINGRKLINWEQCEKLKVGDYVVLLNQIQHPVDYHDSNTEWLTPDIALLIGLLMGDGCIDERQATFRQNEGPILDLFEETCKKIGQPCFRGKNEVKVLLRGYSGGNHKLLPITKDKTPLLFAIKKLGLGGQRSATKALPEWTKNMPRKSAAQLLRGLILSDGSVGKSFSFASTSKNLRDWVSSVAHRFGCPGRTTDNEYLYSWYGYTEFTQHLAKQLGSFDGKLHAEEIFTETVKHTHRRLNKKLHRQKIVEINVLPPQPTVCVTVLEGDEHIYCDRGGLVTHNTLEDVLFGRVAGAAPAFQVRLRINVARSKMTPIAMHMAMGLTNVMRTFLSAVQALGEAVVIGGERITTSMAKKYRDRVTVSIQPKDLTGRNQDISLANMALQFGLPWDWIAENILDIEDPATLRLQRDIMEIEQLPQVKEKLTAEALDQLDLLVEEEEFTDVNNIDLSNLPPEVAEALANLQGQSSPTDDIQSLIEGAVPAGPQAEAGGGLLGFGRGPYPEGAAPQTLQGGRGPEVERTPPPLGSPQISTEDLGLSAGEILSY